MAVTAIRQFMAYGFGRPTFAKTGNFEAPADGSPTKNVRREADKRAWIVQLCHTTERTPR